MGFRWVLGFSVGVLRFFGRGFEVFLTVLGVLGGLVGFVEF